MKNDDTSLLLIHSQSADVYNVFADSPISESWVLDSSEGASYDSNKSYANLPEYSKETSVDFVDQKQQYTHSCTRKEDTHFFYNALNNNKLINRPIAVVLGIVIAKLRSSIDSTLENPDDLKSELFRNSDPPNTGD
jgi:hypothetical protein